MMIWIEHPEKGRMAVDGMDAVRAAAVHGWVQVAENAVPENVTFASVEPAVDAPKAKAPKVAKAAKH